MPRLVRPIIAAVAAGGLALAGLVAAAPASAASSAVVVNEVYGGGGNSGATYTNDFIELQNRGDAAVDLDGWSVQYHSKSTTGAWQATVLTGTLQPGALYLVQEAKGSGGTMPLPAPDAQGSLAMSGTDGTVALVHGTGLLTCANPTDCAAASIDLVGYGAATIAEGTAVGGASNTTSVQRGDGAGERALEESLHHALQRGSAGFAARLGGQVDVAGAFLAVFEVALVLENAQERAHRGVAGSVGKRFVDFGRGRFAAGVNDVHDLPFTPGEMLGGSIRHAKFLAHGSALPRKMC